MLHATKPLINPIGFTYDSDRRLITMPNNVKFYHDPKHPDEYHWGDAIEVLDDLYLAIKHEPDGQLSFTLPPQWQVRPYRYDSNKTSVCDTSGHSQLILGPSRKTGEFIARVVTWVMFSLSDAAQAYNQQHLEDTEATGMFQFFTSMRHPEQLAHSVLKAYKGSSPDDYPHFMTDKYIYRLDSQDDRHRARKTAVQDAFNFWNDLPYLGTDDEQDNED